MITMTNNTINGIINKFEVIAASHSEINSFGFGWDFDINYQKGSNFVPTQLWVQLLNSQVLIGRSAFGVQRNFRLYILDLERRDEKNRQYGWNQMELILLDVIRIFGYGGGIYKVVNNPIIQPFQESFAEKLVGFWCDITIETPELQGNCGVPGIS